MIWAEPGTTPPHAVMAEMPCAADTSNARAAYLRKLVANMLHHKACHPSQCFKGCHEKVLSKCEYGFSFEVQHGTVSLEDGVYVRWHDVDRNVVPDVLDVLMGFYQNQMCRQVIFLQTELNPFQIMLKPKFELLIYPDFFSISATSRSSMGH